MDQKMFTDQTGRFPVSSYRGMQYIMALHESSSNVILVKPMRNRTSGEMLETYQILIDRLKEAKIEPKICILDNECLGEYKKAMQKNGIKYQLVPPNDHRRNIAEKRYRYLKIILFLSCVVLSFLSQCACGAGSYFRSSTS